MYDRRAANAELEVEPEERGAVAAPAPAAPAGGAPRPAEAGDSSAGVHASRIPLLRSAQARSIDGGPLESPSGSPRARRPPRESRRVSLARTPDYIQLNQYKLLEPIGQGSYGIVKLAYNEEDDTHYAMKILSKKKLLRRAGVFGRLPPRRGTSSNSGSGMSGTTQPEPEAELDPLRRVYREIAVLKKLDHPNVVKLVEVLDDPQEDQLYLVFELVEGGPVLEVGSDAPLPVDTARNYFRDVLLAVEYLHYQRIVHRDIKPANILVGADGRVLLGDLGGAGELGTAGTTTGSSGAAGTPAFRAPEVAESSSSSDPRAADVWSLGATLFALVHGSLPFPGQTVLEVTARIRRAPLLLPPTSPAPPSLRHLLHRMMHKDPQQRATIQEVKCHPWVSLNGKQPLPSTEENCRLVVVTDEDMEKVVTSIPNLATLILIKTMLKKHSFQNPFSRTRENSREGSASEPAIKLRLPHPALAASGRSASAPSNYLTMQRQASFDAVLPSVDESIGQETNLNNLSSASTSSESTHERERESLTGRPTNEKDSELKHKASMDQTVELKKANLSSDLQCKILSLQSDR